MNIHTRPIEYRDGDAILEGRLAVDSTRGERRPAVMVVHAYGGCSAFEQERARSLAQLGYVGFAADLYGKGVYSADPAVAMQLMQPFLDDRSLLLRRLTLALAALQEQPEVDGNRIAAIGYCFGGLAVLDLARSGAPVAGVASFHGMLDRPDRIPLHEISSKVLVLHGWQDPMVPPEHVLEFAREMKQCEADWQLLCYGTAVHAFTNHAVNDRARGLQYDPAADRRSWTALRTFLSELFYAP